MHYYQVVLEASGRHPAEQQDIRALSASAVFAWAERSAHGRRFEIFEDGVSLGTASLSGAANFWVLSSASTRATGAATASVSAEQRRELAPLAE